MEFEDLLVEVGEYGKYQKHLVIFFLVPCSVMLPLFFMNVLFMVSSPDHWCNVPELDSWNLTLEQEHLLVRPHDPNVPNAAKCTMNVLNYTELMFSPSWNWTIPENTTTMKCNNGWKYDKSDYEKTATTGWNMVCDDSHYTSFVLTLASVGSILGTPIYGTLADRIGRKPTFYITVVVACISGIGSILMKNFTAFVIMRTINGSIMPSIFQIPFIILLELVGPTKRTMMNGVSNNCWTMGMFLLALIAWLSRDWVILGLITSSSTIIFLLYWRFLPESPRWLFSRERYEEAADIMLAVSQKNGKKHTRDELLGYLKKLGEKSKKEKEKESIEGKNEISSLDVFRYRSLRRTFLINTTCWIACGAAYYGLQINIPNLGGNEFVNFFMLAVVEIPGFFFSWYFMEKLGRRWCSVFTIALTGLALLVPVFNPAYGMIPSLIGKFAISGGFMAMYQQGSELYPTVIRSVGMGLNGTFAGIITIGVPYVIYLAEYGEFIPYLIISVICLAAGSAASFLPETLNEVLPQTIMDAEEFFNNRNFCDCTRRRKPSCYEHRESIAQVNGENEHNVEMKSVNGEDKSIKQK